MSKKKQLKNLRQLSVKLPYQFTEGKLKVKGQEIIDQTAQRALKAGKKFEIPQDKQGNIIDAEKWYEMNINVPVNHYRRIKKLYNSGGWEKVEQYGREVINLHWDALENHKRMMATMQMPQL